MSDWDTTQSLLTGIPDLLGAACRGRSDLYDETVERPPDAKQPTKAALDAARTAALALCARCSALDPCRTYIDGLPASQRPRGIVAGYLIRSGGKITRQPPTNQPPTPQPERQPHMTDTAPARARSRKRVRQPDPIVEPVRDEQPKLVAQARAQAERARGRATHEEPWYSVLDAIPAYNADGHRTGHAVAMPSAAAKELWGARLAFDMLDAGDDDDLISDIQTRYYRELGGDTGCLSLVTFSALRAVAAGVVPQLLEDLDENASNHDARVRIAEGRTKAWDARVADLRPTTGAEH